ncbi:hypothetical protein OHA18_12520 [Kribbella sp. NBC_00709]|uniref:hypothetical protein n=1 Tax=Kribbella sp. NBC_00709 TaxID=2975972 RepID=UPI002E292729|nr:hypothetical protein [Kribbella sp. NBC_00709]
MPSPSEPAFNLSAWVDESVIVGPVGGSGTYTMAAVVTDDACCDDLQRELAGLVDSARRKRLISHELQVRFARPAREPMLWLPDAVAGATSAAVLGEERWLGVMDAVVTVHRVVIR